MFYKGCDMSITGRPSKVITLGYADEIDKLRSEGYSYSKIADILNERYPNNPTISKDVVHRHLKGLTKKTLKDKPIAIEEEIIDVFQDLIYKVKLSSLSASERSALIQYMRAKNDKLKSKAHSFYAGHKSKPHSESEKTRKYLLDFSLCLCPNCRRKVVETLTD
jgi:intein-encoded DNA endonuclease-like protein